MIRFNNDYNRSAHPAILEALSYHSGESFAGYGQDPLCEAAAMEIKKHLGNADADIHFLLGGTQVNYTVIAAALRPYQAVISADSGHINVHETGAVENIGHKILALPTKDGKITAAQIKEQAAAYVESDLKEHIVQPKLVYISQPTEWGTLYSRQELKDISAVCRAYDLLLFVDGARMAYGLAAGDVTLADLAQLCDAFYIGGTKCGALFGEAVVLTHPLFKEHFRAYMKQNGALLAKGWLLGLQFYTLFKDDLYLSLGQTAVVYANELKATVLKKNIPLFVDSPTNQQFFIMENKQLDRLAEKYTFENNGAVDDTHSCVRFCTSWSTTRREIEALIADINDL